MKALHYAATICEPFVSGRLSINDSRLGLFTLPLPAEAVIVDGMVVQVCPTASVVAMEGVFEVAAIVAHRKRASGFMEFLTSYVGYEFSPTWQPLDDFKTGRYISNVVLLAYAEKNRLVL